ncbi:MAG: DNA primase, partial [Bdellovibrionales bacterium]|nr:DNA primase [Bdellovibrionales bacterium]
MAIPSEIIEAVRERTSLVDVISESVKLRPAGKNHLGLCPFHREKTPSFNVREDEGTYHCFGCGKHGSVFDFVMETRGLSFPEAVSFLANRIGIKIPESGSWKRS